MTEDQEFREIVNSEMIAIRQIENLHSLELLAYFHGIALKAIRERLQEVGGMESGKNKN